MSESTQHTQHAENMRRLTFQQRLAEANGFSLPPPIYALGTPVIDLGHENFRKSRQSFEALPDARTVFAPFLARVAGEMRADATVRVNDLRMTSDGRLIRVSGDPARRLFFDGSRSLRALLERTACDEPGAAATYLATIPPERRQSEVNSWLASADDKTTAVLRTRLALATMDDAPGDQTTTALALAPQAYGREVYAIVSERYGTGLEVDALARHLQTAIERGLLPGDARGEITYDGRAATIRALWHSNINPLHACAGEVFKSGISITASDDRSASISVDASLWRNLCLNFIVIGTADRNFGSRRHTGDTADLVAWLVGALGAASRSVAGFAALWDRARVATLDTITRDLPMDVTRDQAVAGVFRGLLQAGKLALPGYRGEAAVGELTTQWKREPEYARVGIVNAITRAAHESTALRGAFTSDELEATGGVLLASDRPFQYVERGQVF